MKVKYFECSALLVPDDAAAITHMFVVHGRERHIWTYAEEAIRNCQRTQNERCGRFPRSAVHV